VPTTHPPQSAPAPNRAHACCGARGRLLAFPAAGALINLFFGRRLSKNAIGAIASGAVIGAFAVAVMLLVALLGLPAEERAVTVTLWQWITVGTLDIKAALLIDPLSVVMALVVTGVGGLIHVYAISYCSSASSST